MPTGGSDSGLIRRKIHPEHLDYLRLSPGFHCLGWYCWCFCSVGTAALESLCKSGQPHVPFCVQALSSGRRCLLKPSQNPNEASVYCANSCRKYQQFLLLVCQFLIPLCTEDAPCPEQNEVTPALSLFDFLGVGCSLRGLQIQRSVSSITCSNMSGSGHSPLSSASTSKLGRRL